MHESSGEGVCEPLGVQAHKCYALMRAVLKVARREGLQEARALEQDGMRCQVQRMWMRLRAALN